MTKRSSESILEEVENSRITKRHKALIRVALAALPEGDVDPFEVQILYPRVTYLANEDRDDQPKSVLKFTASLEFIMSGERCELAHPTRQWACADGTTGPIVRHWTDDGNLHEKFETGEDVPPVVTFHPSVLDLGTNMHAWLRANGIEIFERTFQGRASVLGVEKELWLTELEWEKGVELNTRLVFFAPPEDYEECFDYVDITRKRQWTSEVPMPVRVAELDAISKRWAKEKEKPEVKAQVEWLASKGVQCREWGHPLRAQKSQAQAQGNP